MMRRISTFLLMMVFGISLYGQFSMDGQIRPRAEFRDGYRLLPDEDSKPAGQVNQRTRLSLSYSFDDRVSTRVSLQDIRLWGENLTMGSQPSMGVYEAWIALTPSENLSIKAGRQELRYDNQRLMANNDWALSGRSHDALVLQYETGNGSKLHVGAAFNQSANRTFGTAYNRNNYKTLNYIWYHTRLSSEVNASFHLIADGYEHPDDAEDLNLRYTWASYLVYDPDNVQLRFYPAFQHGKTARGQDISAYYFMLEAVRPLSANIQATLGLEFFSGNDQLDPGDTFNAFSDLYGMGHGRNGYMDYFTAFPQHTNNAGLVNPYARAVYALSDRSSLAADLHLFFLQNDYPDPKEPTNAVDRYLGTEIDLVYTYRFNDFTQVQFGYSVLFASESMEALKGGSSDEFAHWAFAMIRMSPRFL